MASRSLSRIILLVVIALAVAAGVEVMVRLLGIAPPLHRQYPRMVPDPHLPFRPPSNASYQMRANSGEFEHEVRTNSAGFRDVEHLIPKPPGVFRILGLGDSFTFGVGASFEDTYLFRAERMLNARPGRHPKVEIVKAGVPRFYPETERRLLEHYGLAYEPDLVVVGLTPNDVSDTVFGVDAVTTDASGFLKTQEAKALGPLGHWLFLNSHAARIALGDYIRHKSAARHPVRWEEIFRDDGFHEPEWQRIEAELTKMTSLAAQAGASGFVVLCIPQRGPWPESSDYPARRLRRWAARNEAVVVDALPLFRAADGQQRLFWEGDPHCTPAGYRLVAEALVDGLDSASLVP